LRLPPDTPPVGEEVPVGGLLAYIVLPGEIAPFERTENVAASAVPSGAIATNGGGASVALGTTRVSSRQSGRDGRPAISPRARRAAERHGLDWGVLVGSGSSGRIRERDVLTALAQSTAPAMTETSRRASPLVRRLATERGVDLDRVTGSAPGGRVTRADVRAAVEPAAPTVPMTPIRRLVAERMAESARTAAPVTLTTEADATELARIRELLKRELAASGAPAPSYTDLLVRLAALALREHPDLNASLVDGRVLRHPAVHVGVAVDTERGLMAPVVRDADRRSALAIAAETVGLIERARAGTIAPDDLHGATFTVTNLGMYEIDAFTPIINLPECAVLGLGQVVARPVVVDEASETVAVRRMMALSLTFDHRLVDGAPAARFLQRVKRLIEAPYVPLMS
jgi:pyruvate dehydrogenase E2 component (dihydrolipoamide acetyltransferase)